MLSIVLIVAMVLFFVQKLLIKSAFDCIMHRKLIRLSLLDSAEIYIEGSTFAGSVFIPSAQYITLKNLFFLYPKLHLSELSFILD